MTIMNDKTKGSGVVLNCAQLRATPLSPKGARGVSMCK
jgi:hypothetical protein